jgi:hypothetical protein
MLPDEVKSKQQDLVAAIIQTQKNSSLKALPSTLSPSLPFQGHFTRRIRIPYMDDVAAP